MPVGQRTIRGVGGRLRPSDCEGDKELLEDASAYYSKAAGEAPGRSAAAAITRVHAPLAWWSKCHPPAEAAASPQVETLGVA